jgi:hypothetical protein
MTLAVCCRSHSALLELTDPGPELTADVETAQQFAAGAGNLKPLKPDRDRTFLDQLAANDLGAIDRYTNESIEAEGGNSAQEIRSWVAAAYAALSAAGPYEMTSRYYRPIPSSSSASASPLQFLHRQRGRRRSVSPADGPLATSP